MFSFKRIALMILLMFINIKSGIIFTRIENKLTLDNVKVQLTDNINKYVKEKDDQEIYKKFLEIFDQEFDQDSKLASAYYLGLIYYYSNKNLTDYKFAVYFFEISYKNEKYKVDSSYHLGLINYEYYKNDLEALKFFHEYENINSKAYFFLGEIYFLHKDYEKAFEYIFKFITSSNETKFIIKSALYLGQMYYHGNGINENHTLAYYYFNKAMNQFIDYETKMLALTWITAMYYYGDYVNKDIDKARLNFIEIFNNKCSLNKSCKVESALYLGVIYLFGLTVDKNIEKSINYFNYVYNNEILYDCKIEAAYYLALIYSKEANYKNLSNSLKLYHEVLNSDHKVYSNKSQVAIYKLNNSYDS